MHEFIYFRTPSRDHFKKKERRNQPYPTKKQEGRNFQSPTKKDNHHHTNNHHSNNHHSNHQSNNRKQVVKRSEKTKFHQKWSAINKLKEYGRK